MGLRSFFYTADTDAGQADPDVGQAEPVAGQADSCIFSRGLTQNRRKSPKTSPLPPIF